MNTAIALMIALQSAASSEAQPPPPAITHPPRCDSRDHNGFDFWVGEWDVFAATAPDTKVADSRIERKHNGCAVIEDWMPLNGQSGTSLNHYDAANGVWRQKWVGSSPGAVEFTGGIVDSEMVLTGNWPSSQAPHALVRMTYSKNDNGSVRQFGQASTDHGKTWQTAFDLTYMPKKDPPE